MSKDEILLHTKNALKQNKLNSAKKDYEDLIKHTSNDIIEEYIQMQSSNKAIIVESKNAIDDIKASLEVLQAKKVIYTLDLDLDFSSLAGEFDIKPYDKNVDDTRDELFKVDTSIVYAKCGVADVGIFGVVSSPKHPRLASLITKNCIVILEKKNIVRSIPEGLKILRNGRNKLPSNMIFIAGPSRTADIELKTVFGVHGPQQVYIILL